MIFLQRCNARIPVQVRPPARRRICPWRSKMIPAMRIQLTLLFTVIALLATARKAGAQTVTLKYSNEPLGNVLNEIKKQTGYLFWYEDDLIKNAKKITIDLKNASITQALDACLKDQPLQYSINDKTIVIKSKPKTRVERTPETSGNIDVHGQVLGETGAPLPGATIRIKGTGRITRSDDRGFFHFEDVPPAAELEIRYVGYTTEEQSVLPQMHIVLHSEIGKLQEVRINAGYYTVTQAERTGSISRIDAKTIAEQPVVNPLAAMIGRMPGVNIEQQSGINGGGFKIEIRGQNSLRNTSTDNGNRPLFLIDGVAFPAASLATSSLGATGITNIASPLNALNPADIESIEVLKDADATAIYGSRGANGVVLITTKKAKAGKAAYELGFQQGISKISRGIRFLNLDQYLTMRTEAFKNDGATPGPTDYDVNGTWDKSRYTDWQKVLIGGTAQNTFATAAVRGGTENTQFSISGNYGRQSTVLPAEFADQKVDGSISINHSSENKKFKMYAALSYALDLNKLPRTDLTQFIRISPNAPALYDASGNLNWAQTSSGVSTWTNPLSVLRQPYNSRSGDVLASGRLSYDILPGLSFASTFGFTSIRFKENALQPIASFAPSPSATAANVTGFNALDTWTVEPQINYRRKLGRGEFNVLFGSTLLSTDQTTETISATGYTSDLLINNIGSAPTRIATNSSNQYRYAALFGRINYNLDGTYILNLTGRRDGSSRFGPDKQFANFGAVGAAWIFSNYDLIRKVLPVLSFGKLRGSYGVTGNDQIANYGYLETYSSTNPYADGSGLFPSQLANADFSWETNKKLEFAADLAFFADRVRLSVAWYRNRSSNQLVGYKLPDITGFATIQYNLPATVQNTGWEFELSTANIRHRDFSWSSSLNVTIPENKLLSYPGIEGSTYANTYTVGASLYQLRKYRYLGVDATTGLYKYLDLNNNGILETGDRQPTRKAYTNHLYGGLQNSFTYKRLSLDVFVQFVSKTIQTPYNSSSLPGTMVNQSVQVLDRWQNPGDAATFQRFSQSFATGGPGSAYNDLFNGDRYLDASFVRIKNLSLSYSLPEAALQKLKIKNLKVFLLGQNLFTFTKFPGDPEVANFTLMPTLKTLTAGVNLAL